MFSFGCNLKLGLNMAAAARESAKLNAPSALFSTEEVYFTIKTNLRNKKIYFKNTVMLENEVHI